MSRVYLEVDGKPVPASECSWLLAAPCGCVCGITTATIGDDALTTPERAMEKFTPNREQRRRDTAAGFTVRLVGDRGEAIAQMRSPSGKDSCPHTPQWGCEPRPELRGYEWAIADFYGSKMRLQHLVPTGDRETHEDVSALCGAKTWGWSSEWFSVADKPDCLRCTAKARKAVAA